MKTNLSTLLIKWVGRLLLEAVSLLKYFKVYKIERVLQ
jgi:hypothetical protein